MFSDVGAFRRDPLGFLQGFCGASEPLVKLNLGPQPAYLVADPDLIKPIFKADEDDIDKGRLVRKMSSVIGTNSLTMSGPAQRARRSAIHGQLARGIASGYVPQMSAIIRESIAHMVAADAFDAHELTSALALRIICDTLFGQGTLSRGDEAVLINAIHLVEDDLADRMFRVMPYWPWDAWRRQRRLKAGRAIMLRVVERARHRAAQSSIVKSLEALKLTDAELADEILVIILAGHHTTGSAAAWLMYVLGTKPHLVADLAREASQITNAAGDVVASRLTQASVSRATALEVLRLHPSSYWYSREIKRPVTLAGIRLKAGTSLIVSPWQLHRDSRFWRDPETFDIHRAHMANRAYVPFGSGPRACVGMGLALLELQLLALELASSCEVMVNNTEPVGLPRPSITLVPPPIQLTVRPRETVTEQRSIA